MDLLMILSKSLKFFGPLGSTGYLLTSNTVTPSLFSLTNSKMDLVGNNVSAILAGSSFSSVL